MAAGQLASCSFPMGKGSGARPAVAAAAAAALASRRGLPPPLPSGATTTALAPSIMGPRPSAAHLLAPGATWSPQRGVSTSEMRRWQLPLAGAGPPPRRPPAHLQATPELAVGSQGVEQLEGGAHGASQVDGIVERVGLPAHCQCLGPLRRGLEQRAQRASTHVQQGGGRRSAGVYHRLCTSAAASARQGGAAEQQHDG